MNEELGDVIKRRRKEKNMSVEDFAEKIGRSRATVYRYENNEIEDMPYTVLIPIAEALDVSPTYLLGLVETPEPIEPKSVLDYIKEEESVDMLIALKSVLDAKINYLNAINSIK